MKPKKNLKKKNEYIHNIYNRKANIIAMKDMILVLKMKVIQGHQRSKGQICQIDTTTKLWLLLERSRCVDEKYGIS